ncbi:hypothetical protein [Xenorhabdus griffiniae]|uniref:hypothetical protein n=1 Tax=Xenorhabdus griffiniae TaxID=351672 RepID=UPI00235A3131|nr:hypothetical protein [Xenorhabdus griffiniae]MDC9603650.1 hypothetical protein [Xenorhabdus griffiniae]
MNNEKIEELMKKSGFTLNDMKLLKAINKRNGTTLLNEMMNLENRFYRLLFILPLAFMVLAFFFLMAGEANFKGFFIAIVILMPLAIFITSFRLAYKSFIFMRKYKRL